MEKSKELALLLGLKWKDGELEEGWNPDFTTDAGKVQLLRLMMERKIFDDFYGYITFPPPYQREYPNTFINLITDTTGKLRDACLEWLRKEKANERSSRKETYTLHRF